ncbi:hypothetical protein [Janthinobacterium agaricidamnosum]|uniref:Putative 6-phosphogluconolactonase domain protein n=1 Tax=Janthinobacterium agaricidamnosum NBRC 102515 = DSM 9628 TaxID=1349767 RepID=W0V144_9BURK|nr:hypothetical protein [Janthinobacterium agaricidamnosum]CDG81053.1 putative 6-phosphogluconolactonase domain protein [Janthinobacterium agaricidamnosum NBRC 102515 = DSM 9628]
MKSLYLRPIVAAACALSLAACGGGSGNLYLGGAITGLAKTGLILSNGASTVTVSSGATTFVFNDLIGSDATYNVQVQQQPTGAKCTVTNGQGKANNFNVNTVIVSCLTDQYTLGGTITGLTTNGLILVNGADATSPPANATNFTFGGTVGDGSAYTVTVLHQPDGQTCSIANGVGRLGSANVNNLQVSCTTP